jgi:hypothetical protein
MLYKIDLARAFRQIPIDPLDVAYLGINWGGNCPPVRFLARVGDMPKKNQHSPLHIGKTRYKNSPLYR